MELLVAECRHVALVARNELFEVAHLPPKARTRMAQGKQRYMTVQGLEGAEF